MKRPFNQKRKLTTPPKNENKWVNDNLLHYKLMPTFTEPPSPWLALCQDFWVFKKGYPTRNKLTEVSCKRPGEERSSCQNRESAHMEVVSVKARRCNTNTVVGIPFTPAHAMLTCTVDRHCYLLRSVCSSMQSRNIWKPLSEKPLQMKMDV